MATTPPPRKAAQKTISQLNPRTQPHELEFGGHLGTTILSFLTPATIYFLYFACSPSTPHYSSWLSRFASGNWLESSFFDVPAFVAYFGWYAVTVLAWKLLPGQEVEGTELRNEGRIIYKINGFSTLLLSLGLATGQILHNGPENFTFIYDHFLGFITASLVMSVAQALYCYLASYTKNSDGSPKLLALAGNSGRFFYDFWMGRELNPQIGSFDIKTHNELRPGLILWMLVDISMACEQWCRLGGRLTASMVLVVCFHSFYVLDALYNEPAIYTTMDVTTDGFGFMLAIGDLCWVPFTYCLQARYLAFHQTELSPAAITGIFAVQGLGYYIFRTANLEKNEFRLGRNPKNLKSMETESGSKLLISGWWGRSRHPNYLGDWLMAWAWCLPTGFSSPFPYFYVIYFAILLVHRQMRDDEACKLKYGKDWDAYCKLVPYKIIPYIY